MATALLHDVISYSTTRGCVVYSCSLDAKGAFDAIPHCILFDKAQSIFAHIIIAGSSCINGIGSSLLKLNGEGATARLLMLISLQDKVGCLRLCYSGRKRNLDTSKTKENICG